MQFQPCLCCCNLAQPGDKLGVEAADVCCCIPSNSGHSVSGILCHPAQSCFSNALTQDCGTTKEHFTVVFSHQVKVFWLIIPFLPSASGCIKTAHSEVDIETLLKMLCIRSNSHRNVFAVHFISMTRLELGQFQLGAVPVF